MANISTDKALFTMTPAPSEQNQSKEIWNGYLNDGIDEINVVNMRTNELVGTIGGGGGEYKFDTLPNSYLSQTIYDEAVLGDAIEQQGSSLFSGTYYTKLDDGQIVRLIPGNQSHFNNGIFLLYGITILSSEPYLIAFKVNEDDKTLLEKVAEIQIPNTSNIILYGYNYTYQPIGVDNECYYIYNSYPTSDSTLLETYQTKVTITESNGIYSLSLENINYNYGGKTVLELYNENAPSPVSGVDWIYRSPLYSSQDFGSNMLNGRDEGWVWYGNYNSGVQTLSPYLAGFNIVTGETAYIEPINSLANTTNFNPVGTVDYTYFVNNWQSHPAGVYFGVYNQQTFDDGNNTNSVTALYSPRWINNDKVNFLTTRTPDNGVYISINGFIDVNYTTYYCFDSENIYLIYDYEPTEPSTNSRLIYISRYKLDSEQPIFNFEIAPRVTEVYNINEYFNFNDNVLISYKELGNTSNSYSRKSFVYWNKNQEKSLFIQSNTYSILNMIDNKIYSYPQFINGTLVIEYDEYKKITL